MCFCESDAVKAMIHVKARKHHPGIRFHERALGRVAADFGLESTQAVHALSEPELRRMTRALLEALPSSHVPSRRTVAA